MFGSSPTREEHSALTDLVHAQGDLLQVLGDQVTALIGVVDVISPMSNRTNAELHAMKGVAAALVAEVAGRSDEPFKELMDILRRVRFTIREFMPDDDILNDFAQDLYILVAEHAETYLRRGEASGQ